jgi:putative DNA primase/helicase
MTQTYVCDSPQNCTSEAIWKTDADHFSEPTDPTLWSRWAADQYDRDPWYQQLKPWQQHAEELARWVMDQLVVRDDAYGGYYIAKDGGTRRCKRDGAVTLDLIANHFGLSTPDTIIGLYTTSLGDQCKGWTTDLDRHDGNPDDLVEKNMVFALDRYRMLEDLGFHPLLIDSNGLGGLHLRGFFADLVPAAQVRSFGLWLVREWEKCGLPREPEVFPKQDSIDGKYGNFVRLFGRHHKRRFLSRVWDGKTWREGEDAIQIILSRKGDPGSLIPKEALEYQLPRKARTISMSAGAINDETEDWWKNYRGDLRTLDILTLLETKELSVSQISDREFEVECPWAAKHTTGDDTARIMIADQGEDLFPAFHCFHDHCKDRKMKDVLALFSVEEVDRHCNKMYGQQDEKCVISSDDPLGTARLFVSQKFTNGGERSLVHYHGDWYLWDGRRYDEITEDDIKAKVWKWLDTCRQQTKTTRKKASELVPFKPTPASVKATLDALKAEANLPSSFETPGWIGESSPCRPESVIAFANGLFDLDCFLATGQTRLLAHNPRWFSTNSLPHAFDPQAPCPHWMAFMRQVFEGDEERVRTLKQWFGYNLTHDNRQQKFAMLVGPPRSGKGTTMKVLTHLLGEKNVASPTLTSLGGRFGLAPLVGKQAALVPDAHLGRASDAVAILERLKSVVGCDEQCVDRKNKSELANVRINARFTIAVNELPRLPDASVSLRAKMVVIPYSVTFEGKEDFNLSERLLAEVPGITNWALAGLVDLRQTGRLLQPKAGDEIMTEFVRLSSPLAGFIEDCCDVGPDKSEATTAIFTAWSMWCRDNGHEVGSATVLGTKLRASLPGMKRVRVREGDNLTYQYHGLRLKSDVANRVHNNLQVIG